MCRLKLQPFSWNVTTFVTQRLLWWCQNIIEAFRLIQRIYTTKKEYHHLFTVLSLVSHVNSTCAYKNNFNTKITLKLPQSITVFCFFKNEIRFAFGGKYDWKIHYLLKPLPKQIPLISSLYIRSMFGKRLQNVFHKTVQSRNKCFYNILNSSWSF